MQIKVLTNPLNTMKKCYFYFVFFFCTLYSNAQDFLISGVLDGPLPGGLPKTIELYAINDIPDLSDYGIGTASNQGGAVNIEFVFYGSANAGDFLYIATEQAKFNEFFGFDPDFVDNVTSINGDDAIVLFNNVVDDGSGNLSGDIIDSFGVITVDGTGEPWEYLDGWAYRVSGTGPDGTTFVLGNWTFSGINALDGATTNSAANSPFPIGTFTYGTAAARSEEINGFTVFPNPVTHGRIWINTKSNGVKEVSIFDILGKQVIARQVSGKEVSIAGLSKGIYILKVIENGKIATRKLVIK